LKLVEVPAEDDAEDMVSTKRLITGEKGGPSAPLEQFNTGWENLWKYSFWADYLEPFDAMKYKIVVFMRVDACKQKYTGCNQQ
jgi:hypothetical protein